MANSLNTITVDGITYDAAEYAKEHTTASKNDELGKEVFLQLLVAQMKYQDPLDPQDNSEYVAELANFSALEQMTNVASNLESLSTIVNNIDTSVLVGQLSSMMGKGVNWTTTTTTQSADGTISANTNTYSGIIQGVSLSGGTPTVIVNVDGTNYRVAVSDIDNIFDIEDAANQNSDSAAANTTAAGATSNANDTSTSVDAGTGGIAINDALSDVFGTDVTSSTDTKDSTNAATATDAVSGAAVASDTITSTETSTIAATI